jgi:hypothetical protein
MKLLNVDHCTSPLKARLDCVDPEGILGVKGGANPHASDILI